jgi:hypothetical protein
MPTAGAAADNFAAGGIACPVDLATGCLGAAVRKKLRLAHFDIHQHPDTGAQIAGRTLPCWREAVDLALVAHTQFSEFPSIGWDIAITTNGPVLVEGNYNWDVVLTQQAGWRALGDTEYIDHLFAWFHHRSDASSDVAPL